LRNGIPRDDNFLGGLTGLNILRSRRRRIMDVIIVSTLTCAKQKYRDN
jgi:hypothetical protein